MGSDGTQIVRSVFFFHSFVFSATHKPFPVKMKTETHSYGGTIWNVAPFSSIFITSFKNDVDVRTANAVGVWRCGLFQLYFWLWFSICYSISKSLVFDFKGSLFSLFFPLYLTQNIIVYNVYKKLKNLPNLFDIIKPICIECYAT